MSLYHLSPSRLDIAHLIALGDPDKTLTDEQRAEMAEGCVDLALDWFNQGQLTKFLEVIDRLFTLFIDSFEIINSQLPPICDPKYLDMLSKATVHHGKEYHSRVFKSYDVPDALADEMADFIDQHIDLVYALLDLKDRRYLKLKSTGQLHEVSKIRELHRNKKIGG